MILIPTFFVLLFNSLADRIGRRWVLLLLVLGMGLPYLAIVLWTPTLPWFLLFYAMATFFTVSNLWQVPANEEAPALERARLIAVIYAIGQVPLAAVLPPLLVDRLGLDWRWMYGAQFLSMLPLLLLWLPMRKTGRHQTLAAERQRNSGLRWRPLGLGSIDRTDVRYITLSTAITACLLVFMVLYFWSGYFFMTVRGFTLTQYSQVLLAAILAILLGNLTGGWLLDQAGRKQGMMAGCLGLTVCTAGTGYLPDIGPAVALTLAGFFVGVCGVWCGVYIPEVFPTERRASCAGWVTSLARVAYVAGPALAALLLKAFPSMDGFWVAAGAVMLVPVTILWLANPLETQRRELEEIEQAR